MKTTRHGTCLRQCCLPAPDLPTTLLHPGILHLSFPVSRCQWSRVTKSSCLSVSDTKKVGLVLLRLRFWKLFINEGSIHCLRFDEEEEDELPGGDSPDFIGVAKDVWTFFCALRNHDNKAPFESSSLCSISRCYVVYMLIQPRSMCIAFAYPIQVLYCVAIYLANGA